MSGELERALQRVDARKAAMQVEGPRVAQEEEGRLYLCGTDLDWPELMRIKRSIVRAPTIAIVSGANPAEVSFGMWVDGLVHGLALAEGRRKEAGE